jgi:hypothetical protein
MRRGFATVSKCLELIADLQPRSFGEPETIGVRRRFLARLRRLEHSQRHRRRPATTVRERDQCGRLMI